VEGTTVTVDAVEVVVEDAVKDKARITLARPMQQGKVFVPIFSSMCLNTVRSLQQIKCALLKNNLGMGIPFCNLYSLVF
jgi:hypothetical protein